MLFSVLVKQLQLNNQENINFTFKWKDDLCDAIKNAQIYTRDPRPPIPPCVMVLSAMGLFWGSSGFLPTMHAITDAKPMRPQISPAMFFFLPRLQ